MLKVRDLNGRLRIQVRQRRPHNEGTRIVLTVFGYVSSMPSYVALIFSMSPDSSARSTSFSQPSASMGFSRSCARSRSHYDCGGGVGSSFGRLIWTSGLFGWVGVGGTGVELDCCSWRKAFMMFSDSWPLSPPSAACAPLGVSCSIGSAVDGSVMMAKMADKREKVAMADLAKAFVQRICLALLAAGAPCAP